MTNYVDFHNESTNGPSTLIWGDCPILRGVDMGRLYGFHDDFLDYESTATGTVNKSGTPTFEGDCTLAGTAVAGGAVALFGTTDNEEAALQRGGSDSAPYVIAAASGSGKKLWFECRVKKSTIANTIGAFFVGLAGENAGIADFIADADGDDFSDVDLIGFFNLADDGDTMDIVFQKTGAAFDTVSAAAVTLEADTYVKLGIKYDPDAPSTKRVKFFIDGVEHGTYVGETSADATDYITDTTNFPGGEEMSPLIAIKQQSATDMTVTMDWWRCYQER